MKTSIKATHAQAQARDSYEWEMRKAEAATKGEPLVREETPKRNTQEIQSAPGRSF